jgi:predicted membrane protein
MSDMLNALSVGVGEAAWVLLGRLGLDLFFTVLTVRVVYYRLYRSRDYVFTYFLINLVTFALAYILSNVRMELGFAMSLFAVFGILRYRTEGIAVRNLTYLFVVIGVALLNALTSGGITLGELLIANVAVVGTVAVLEAAPSSGREESRLVRYDRLDLLSPDVTNELITDLRKRTHLPVERCEIGDVDLLRDSADIRIHYRVRRPS